MTTPTIELKPSAHPLSDAERDGDPGQPRLRPPLHRPHGHHQVDRGPRLARRRSSSRTRRCRIDPANMTLHYAQTIFEGLKAYRAARRLASRPSAPRPTPRASSASARRLAMPELPVETFIEACDVLVAQDKDVGAERGRGSRSTCGPSCSPPRSASASARPTSTCSWSSPRRPAPTSPAASSRSRSGCPRSTSAPRPAAPARPSPAATTPPRSSPRPRPSSTAATRWSGSTRSSAAGSRRWAGMNLYFVVRRPRSSPPSCPAPCCPASPATRCCRIAADLGYEVGEGRISVDDWRRGNEDGTLTEVFACGTAAVITPVGSVKSTRGDWTVGRRRARRGHDAAARGAARHPDRPRRRPARLDAPARRLSSGAAEGARAPAVDAGAACAAGPHR